MDQSKVLLIEDDKTMVMLLSTLLKIEGFQVVDLEADASLENIFKNVKTEKPALILLDVNLRQANGFDLLKLIREDEDLSDTRVLVSSGMDFSERCQLAGADGFILKPYMPDDLIRMMRQAFEDTSLNIRE